MKAVQRFCLLHGQQASLSKPFFSTSLLIYVYS